LLDKICGIDGRSSSSSEDMIETFFRDQSFKGGLEFISGVGKVRVERVVVGGLISISDRVNVNSGSARSIKSIYCIIVCGTKSMPACAAVARAIDQIRSYDITITTMACMVDLPPIMLMVLVRIVECTSLSASVGVIFGVRAITIAVILNVSLAK
jgi:hypothetical protein